MLSNSLKTGNELLEKDEKYVWHPWSVYPGGSIPVSHAEGIWLYTPDGRKILDGVSSWWVNLFGHAHPYVSKALAKQAGILEHVIFAGFTHEPAITLSERLIKLLPDFSKAYFSDNGSTSVEVALKMALQYWFNKGEKKTKLVGLDGAYHGDTFGAMSMGERCTFTAPFNAQLFEVDFIPFPDDIHIEAAVKQLEILCATGEVAAFMFEPLLQGTSGMRTYSPENLQRLLEVAKKYKVITIADEVFTGFGRTGKNFAIDYLNQKPDLICLSKGITAGFLPLGVTICNDEILSAFNEKENQKIFYHGHSYTGNPLSCATANASLDLLLSDTMQQQIREIEKAHQAFAATLVGHNKIKRLSVLGTVLSIEIKTEEDGKGYFNSLKEKIYQYFLSKDILLRPLGNVIYFLPAYIITEEERNLVYREIETFLNMLA